MERQLRTSADPHQLIYLTTLLTKVGPRDGGGMDTNGSKPTSGQLRSVPVILTTATPLALVLSDEDFLWGRCSPEVGADKCRLTETHKRLSRQIGAMGP